NLTRRDFLKAGSLAAAGAMFVNYPLDYFAKPNEKSKVILIRNEKVLDVNGKIVPEVLEQMLDDAVKILFNTKNSAAAWKKILKPEDVLGIKTNTWKNLRTPVELEQAFKNRALAVGITEENISINDHGILKDPVFKRATALINSRPMRTHYWSGVGSLIKNYIMFIEAPSALHPDSCADLATVWNLPHVKGKTRLNVLVMLTPLFHSVGPHGYSAEYVWKYNGLIVGTDPVACDSTGLRIIEAKRKEFFGEDNPLNPPAKHIELADTRHHLGTADPKKIDLVKIGLKEGILI
ncbi:MAG: twin-arginine translocation signal domain-containing protein, partial [Ignavibacteria bacterium]|nr:twin-arginine translocation signal domain-containing protein [Ignavibacteria bacterium]